MDQNKMMGVLDSLDWNSIRDLVNEVCVSLRLAGEVTTDPSGAQHLWFMPHVDEAPGDQYAKIHLSLLAIGVDKAVADSRREEFINLVAGGSEVWMEGPSYIHLGGAMGSQELAMELIALGRYYGLWNVLSPQSMGIDDPELAGRMAGMGMVNAHGWHPEGDARWDPSLLDVPQPEIENAEG